MDPLPPIRVLDVQKVKFSVMPRKANGRVDANASISWQSSNPEEVVLEPGTEPFVYHDPQFDEDVTVPGAFNCYAKTPLKSGSATITCSASGYETVEQPFSYDPGAPRSLNFSVSAPEFDEEA